MKLYFVSFRRPNHHALSEDYYRVQAHDRQHAIGLGREYLQRDYGTTDAHNARLIDVELMPHEHP